MNDLHPIEASTLHGRRERVYLVLAGLFLGSMTMLNILGTSRFVDLSFEVAGMKIPMALAIGVLPYNHAFLRARNPARSERRDLAAARGFHRIGLRVKDGLCAARHAGLLRRRTLSEPLSRDRSERGTWARR